MDVFQVPNWPISLLFVDYFINTWLSYVSQKARIAFYTRSSIIFKELRYMRYHKMLVCSCGYKILLLISWDFYNGFSFDHLLRLVKWGQFLFLFFLLTLLPSYIKVIQGEVGITGFWSVGVILVSVLKFKLFHAQVLAINLVNKINFPTILYKLDFLF